MKDDVRADIEFDERIDREINAQETLSTAYPSVAVRNTWLGLHTFREDDRWHVWLNTDVADFDGLCLALGEIGGTRNEAINQARKHLRAALRQLAIGYDQSYLLTTSHFFCKLSQQKG